MGAVLWQFPGRSANGAVLVEALSPVLSWGRSLEGPSGTSRPNPKKQGHRQHHPLGRKAFFKLGTWGERSLLARLTLLSPGVISLLFPSNREGDVVTVTGCSPRGGCPAALASDKHMCMHRTHTSDTPVCTSTKRHTYPHAQHRPLHTHITRTGAPTQLTTHVQKPNTRAHVFTCVCVRAVPACVSHTYLQALARMLRPALLAALGLILCLLISRFLPLSEMMFIPSCPTCPQFAVIHTAKGFREVNEAKVDVF